VLIALLAAVVVTLCTPASGVSREQALAQLDAERQRMETGGDEPHEGTEVFSETAAGSP